jgi:hypothetical protein
VTPLVLLMVLAQPEPMARTVTPAPPVRFRDRVRLLPDLMEQIPGDAVQLAVDAEAILVSGGTKTYDDSALVRAMAVYEKAARCSHADWGPFAAQVRRNGLIVSQPGSPFEPGTRQFLLQAERQLHQDQPAEALRSIGLALALIRHLDRCPAQAQHRLAVDFTEELLKLLEECQSHPRCPSLADALAALPRPLLSPRAVLEGERLRLYGTFPEIDRLLADPVGTRLGPRTMAQLEFIFQLLKDSAGQRNLLPVRVELGRAILRADAGARQALRAAGYSEKVVAATPAVNAAVLHAVFVGEERLSREAEALSLPYPQASTRLATLARERPDPPDPALVPPRLYLVIDEAQFIQTANFERRLDVLCAVEALRQHAGRTGSWPAREDLAGLPLPDDSMTGRPFGYRREGNVAILEADAPGPPWPGVPGVMLRLTLRKPEERKP